MSDLLKRISETISGYRMLRASEPVLTAVSGGADSVCLMLALKELGYPVSAVHVEHGIRGQESLDDCAFVEKLCRREGIRLTVRHIDAPAISAAGGRSLEETARDARYGILLETAEKEGIPVIATAHNLGDQAETVLWNLTRGSSLAGLCGILPVREVYRVQGEPFPCRLVRPLLECGREEIETWLRSRGQTWRTDQTNQDPSITRNAIRLQVIPELERLNAAAQRHIAQTAGDLAQIERYLNEVTDQAYRDAVLLSSCGVLRIDLATLGALPDPIRSRVFHRAAGEAQGGLRDITREHVDALMRLSGLDNGKRITLPGGNLAVREEGAIVLETLRHKGKNDTGKKGAGEAEHTEIRIDRDGEYAFASGMTVRVRFGTWEGGDVPKKKFTKVLAYDTMTPYITLRTRREGDWLALDSSGSRKKLGRYLIDEKVPRDRRDSVPLIAQGAHILWVIGLRISEDAKVSAGSRCVEITAESVPDSPPET